MAPIFLTDHNTIEGALRLRASAGVALVVGEELMTTEWRSVAGQSTYTPERFTPEVYQQVMSGKPRASGALCPRCAQTNLR